MSALRGYLFTIVAAALCVSVVELLPQRKSVAKITSLCGGLFLLIALLRPAITLEFGDLRTFLDAYAPDPSLIEEAVEDGENEMARLITEQTREYILDKATAVGASVEVEVTLAELSETYRYPYSVTLRGRWTREQREKLAEYISQTLGIPEERQIWNGGT